MCNKKDHVQPVTWHFRLNSISGFYPHPSFTVYECPPPRQNRVTRGSAENLHIRNGTALQDCYMSSVDAGDVNVNQRNQTFPICRLQLQGFLTILSDGYRKACRSQFVHNLSLSIRSTNNKERCHATCFHAFFSFHFAPDELPISR